MRHELLADLEAKKKILEQCAAGNPPDPTSGICSQLMTIVGSDMILPEHSARAKQAQNNWLADQCLLFGNSYITPIPNFAINWNAGTLWEGDQLIQRKKLATQMLHHLHELETLYGRIP